MGFLLIRAGSVALVVAAAMALVPAAGAAPSWTEPTVLGSAYREVGAPEVAVAPDGEAIATWVASRPARIQVSSRRPGKGWSPPVTIAAASREAEGPRIAASAGKAVIVWVDNITTRSGETRAVLASTRLRGKRWTRPRKISADRRWDYEPDGEEPQVTMTRRGKAIAVWNARDEGHSTTNFVGSATQAAAGTRWTRPVGIPDSYEAIAPQVAATPSDEVVTIWGASYNEESHIGVASRLPKGRWKSALLSNPGPFPQPQLAVTSKGEAIGAWIKEPEGGLEANLEVTARTPGGKWRVKSLEPQSRSSNPRIVTEPGGRATLLWSKYPSTEELAIVASTHPPGGPWSEPKSVATEGLHLPGLYESPIAVTPQGEWIALWITDPEPGERTTIQSASKRRGRRWGEPTRVFTFPRGGLLGGPELQLALGADGEAVAVWRSFNGKRWVIEAAARPGARPGS
jgi:hypothetical protein